MTTMMSIYLFRFVFKKLGIRKALTILVLPIAVITALVSFIF